MALNLPQGPILVIILLMFSISLALSLIGLFARRPILCASFVAVIYVVCLYLSTEGKWRWHDAQEFENRFWTVTAFFFSTALLYAKDSPIAVGQYSSTLGALLVVSFTLFVQFYDRMLHRQEISRKPRLTNNPRSQQALAKKLFSYKATAEEKTRVLTECVDVIDRMYLPSTINNMINLTRVKRQEQKIFRILAGASKEELNYIINHIKLALLFYKVKDHSRIPTDRNRTLILELLCKKRVADLTVMSRAVVLDALMVMKISAHESSEQWVRNIIIRTNGDDLSKFKTYTDSKGDVHSMQKLVYFDIRNDENRNIILAHIKQQAAVQAAHMSLGTKYARLRQRHAWRKVLSDVDDTLYSSGGRFPAGMDTSYPRHALYPGVLSFYRELDTGNCGDVDWEEGRTGNLAFLSARPHVYKDMSEKKSYAKFEALFESKGMHTLPTLLPGSLRSGRAFMMQGNLEPMAIKKFENFVQYYSLYPEFTHVFVGDNGQGDVRAAELIVEKYGKKVLEASYMHIVQPIEKTHGYKDKSTLIKWRSMNIFFFDTYVEASIQAYQMKQMRFKGLVAISLKAKEEFLQVSGWRDPAKRENARLLLNRDLDRVNKLIQEYNIAEKEVVEMIALVDKPRKFENLTRVKCKYGIGIVLDYRSIEGIYTVELISWRLLFNQAVLLYLTEDELEVDTSTTTSVPLPSLFITNNIRNDTKDTDGKHLVNMIVETKKFGKGRVDFYRSEDSVYRIKMLQKRNGCQNPDQNPIHFYCREDALLSYQTEEIRKLTSRTHLLSSPVFSGVRSLFSFLSSREDPPQLDGKQIGSVASEYAVGSVVTCSFGYGHISRRVNDDVFLIELSKPEMQSTMLYLQKSSLTLALVSSISKEEEEEQVQPSRGSNLLSLLGFSQKDLTGISADAPESTSRIFPFGGRVQTPYGEGIVNYHRIEEDMYEVQLMWESPSVGEMIPSNPVLYIRGEQLENSMNEQDNDQGGYGVGLLSFIRKGLYQDERTYNATNGENHDSSSDSDDSLPVLKLGDMVRTPFGIGRILCFGENVIQVQPENSRITGIAYIQVDDVHRIHPISHDSPEFNSSDRRRSFGLNFFEDTFSFLKETFTASPRSSVKSPRSHNSSFSFIPPLNLDGDDSSTYSEDQYQPSTAKYHNQVQVQTKFGIGSVVQSHGVCSGSIYYTIKIEGLCAMAYIFEEDLDWVRVGSINAPILTTFGTGILHDFRQDDGFYIVRLHSLTEPFGIDSDTFPLSMLQSQCIIKEISAVVGDYVVTKFGKGIVVKYRREDDMYEIALNLLVTQSDAPDLHGVLQERARHDTHLVFMYAQSNSFERLDHKELQSSKCGVM